MMMAEREDRLKDHPVHEPQPDLLDEEEGGQDDSVPLQRAVGDEREA